MLELVNTKVKSRLNKLTESCLHTKSNLQNILKYKFHKITQAVYILKVKTVC